MASAGNNSKAEYVRAQLSQEFLDYHKTIVINTVKEKFELVKTYMNDEFGKFNLE